mgnify:FL=1
MNTLYSKELASTTEAIGQTLTEALDVLAQHRWCQSDNTFNIRLCLEEALVNAMEHGNQGQNDSTVKICIDQEDDTCVIRITDEGHGFNPEETKMSDCEELGGRGVCLIKAFMEEVRFDCYAGTLEMVFNRDTFSKVCS